MLLLVEGVDKWKRCMDYIMETAFQVLYVLLCCVQAIAIDMTGCGYSSALEVVENSTDYVITCNNVGGTGRQVTWERGAGIAAGDCVAVNTCQSTAAVFAVLSRPSYSTSTMTVKSATRLLWGNKVVRCFTILPPSVNVLGEDSCTLDVVYPAEASCSVQTNRWTVGGSCSISKVYSSASRYSCQFFNGSQSSQTTPITQPTPYTPQPHQDPDYRTGSCDFSNVALSPAKGDYYYKAVIVPGNVQKVFGPVTVDPPTKPSITCTPSSWVPDGSTVSCTCSTSNLGQPAGKLQGFRGSSVVAPGSDDGSLSLTLPAQTVNRGDHGNSRAQFSCAVDWIQDKTSDVHNVPVAYTPERTELTVNTRTNNLTLNEGDRADFTCRTHGRPSPSMQLVNVTSGQAIQSTAGGDVTVEDKATWLNHSLTAVCQHTGHYNCAVSNSVGNGPRGQVSLFVNCKPRRNGPAPDELPTANVVHTPATVTFYLLAYPTPDQFEYRYHGRVGNASEEGKAVERDLFTTDCWTTGVLYNVSCNVTTNITSDDEAGLYSVWIGNTPGRANFRFIVTFNAPKEKLAEPEGPSDAVAIGAGVGGTIAVLAVIAVVAFVVIKRRGHQEPGISKPTAGPRTNRDSPDEGMIINNTYESSGSVVQNTARNREATKGSAYEDVDVNNAEPVIHPKQEPASSGTTMGSKNTGYAVESKAKPGATAAPTDGPENSVYASVNKSKKSSARVVQTATAESCKESSDHPPLTGTGIKPDVKPTPTKPAKAEKPKKNKEKAKERGKKDKEDKEPLKNPQEAGSVYSNMKPLSMDPIEASVYENCAFEPDDAQHVKRKGNMKQQNDSRTVNKDGLVYSSIQFTQEQLKKAEAALPEPESTEYASIAFGKQAPLQGD